MDAMSCMLDEEFLILDISFLISFDFKGSAFSIASLANNSGLSAIGIFSSFQT